MTATPSPPVTLQTFWALMAVTAVPELLLQAADGGLVGSAAWRHVAYYNGAFWVGLLRDWRPNYPGQPVSMFFTYAFLHAGFWHMASNLAVLAMIGPPLLRRTGPESFVAVWLAAVVGGGIGFGLLSSNPNPMVGASGALFGLFGAWHQADCRQLRKSGQSLMPVLQAAAWLAVLNLVMWWLLAGLLAWQTHFGGYVGGWTAMAAIERWRLRRH